LLNVHRSNTYREVSERLETAENIEIMHRIDQIYTDHPYYGYRRMTKALEEFGIYANRKRIRRLMRLMNLYPVYPGPNLSKLYHAKYVKPYLLRNLAITRPNQVWGVDITYLRMHKGFMYLFVVIDWYSRKIVDWELSSSLEKSFVLTCLNRALQKQKPEIINSDQGSHFTNVDYIKLMESKDVKISMDGKGRATDNARTERFFRSLKQECIYLNEIPTPREMRKQVTGYIENYNYKRPHQSLDYQTPNQAYTLTTSIAA
jgi:putative transposase